MAEAVLHLVALYRWTQDLGRTGWGGLGLSRAGEEWSWSPPWSPSHWLFLASTQTLHFLWILLMPQGSFVTCWNKHLILHPYGTYISQSYQLSPPYLQELITSARNVFALWGLFSVKEEAMEKSQKLISLVYKWVIFFFLEGRNQGTMLGNFNFTQRSLMTLLKANSISCGRNGIWTLFDLIIYR